MYTYQDIFSIDFSMSIRHQEISWKIYRCNWRFISVSKILLIIYFDTFYYKTHRNISCPNDINILIKITSSIEIIFWDEARLMKVDSFEIWTVFLFTKLKYFKYLWHIFNEGTNAWYSLKQAFIEFHWNKNECGECQHISKSIICVGRNLLNLHSKLL